MKLEDRAKSLFLIIAGMHLFVWSVLPVLVYSNPPLDIVESVVWGREWQLGYAKHPPLAIWLTEIAYITGGKNEWLVYVMSQSAIIAAMYFVWQLGREFLSPVKAIMSALLLEGIYYYNFTTPEFNPNVLQIPLWAACGYYFWKAVNSNRFVFWLLLGLSAGLALLTKYFSAVLLFILFLILIITPEGRKSLKSPGPYLTFLVCISLLAPHIIWLFDHDLMTFKYAMRRSENLNGITGHILYPAKFIYSQLLSLAFALLIFLLILKPKKFRLPEINLSLSSIYPWAIGLGPFLLLIIISLIFGTRLRSMWGVPLWNFIGIVFLLLSAKEIKERVFVIFRRCIMVLATLAIFVYVSVNMIAPRIGYPNSVHYPGKDLAGTFTEIWHKKYNGQKLYYVGGLIQAVGNIALHSKDRPKILAGMTLGNNPWVDKNELLNKGGIFVWDLKEKNRPFPGDWLEMFPQIILQKDIVTIPYQNSKNKSLRFVWGVIPPRPSRLY